ncbi:hypothetical protein [Massilia sp. S19_KUP03_FR1]|uniref:hypothetical protein n=1 Tax=Massilia sp. S19_KUP03_FR1 TaxID=3025503 RepID=UPI002FCDAC37
MLNLFDVSVLLFCLASGVWAAEVPGFVHELTNFTKAGTSGAQDVRMRITVASKVAQIEPSVRVGDLLLCASKKCYRARTSGYVNIANTAKGRANVVADVSIPIGTITDI